MAEHFPVLLLLGARQTGKSTLVGHLFGAEARSFVFDPVLDLHGARSDPEFFLDQHHPPLILDEIQFAPELLSGIKRRVDQNRAPGQYILTGSQTLAMLKHMSESLAGRVGVALLEPMTAQELAGRGGERPWLASWLDAPEALSKAELAGPRVVPVFRALWRGGYPGLIGMPDDLVPDFFSSYVRTYVERDVSLLGDVRDQHQFGRFLGLCAALSGQEINHSELGRELSLSPQSAGRWLSLLTATYLWSETSPYSGNAIKRISKRPKGYLVDSGLASQLQRIGSPAGLETSPHLGAMFETMVVAEIRRMLAACAPSAGLFHWRTHAGAEVDVVIELDGELWPIEIKCTAQVTRRHEGGFKALRATYPRVRIRPNLIVAATSRITRVSEDTFSIPWHLQGDAAAPGPVNHDS
ncbi:MAG: ATP-binding protein [Candidatus Sericytochromatia bacterium]|uniref:ATP-binding protein n=1 Tax=Candidatus Tanganyikabacteria bacterium TaxID=2961651 RepID=A0A937X674_9BACT|nr:ATP-binding protein [Candidatus Tanganyikabacteria bacterium]